MSLVRRLWVLMHVLRTCLSERSPSSRHSLSLTKSRKWLFSRTLIPRRHREHPTQKWFLVKRLRNIFLAKKRAPNLFSKFCRPQELPLKTRPLDIETLAVFSEDELQLRRSPHRIWQPCHLRNSSESKQHLSSSLKEADYLPWAITRDLLTIVSLLRCHKLCQGRSTKDHSPLIIRISMITYRAILPSVETHLIAEMRSVGAMSNNKLRLYQDWQQRLLFKTMAVWKTISLRFLVA